MKVLLVGDFEKADPPHPRTRFFLLKIKESFPDIEFVQYEGDKEGLIHRGGRQTKSVLIIWLDDLMGYVEFEPKGEGALPISGTQAGSGLKSLMETIEINAKEEPLELKAALVDYLVDDYTINRKTKRHGSKGFGLYDDERSYSVKFK